MSEHHSVVSTPALTALSEALDEFDQHYSDGVTDTVDVLEYYASTLAFAAHRVLHSEQPGGAR